MTDPDSMAFATETTAHHKTSIPLQDGITLDNLRTIAGELLQFVTECEANSVPGTATVNVNNRVDGLVVKVAFDATSAQSPVIPS